MPQRPLAPMAFGLALLLVASGCLGGKAPGSPNATPADGGPPATPKSGASPNEDSTATAPARSTVNLTTEKTYDGQTYQQVCATATQCVSQLSRPGKNEKYGERLQGSVSMASAHVRVEWTAAAPHLERLQVYVHASSLIGENVYGDPGRLLTSMAGPSPLQWKENDIDWPGPATHLLIFVRPVYLVGSTMVAVPAQPFKTTFGITYTTDAVT